MIPESTFDIMVAGAFLFLLYSVIDYRNHLYANIVITAVDGILFGYLGQAVSIGAISFTSASLGSILDLLAVISFGYCIIMVYDLIVEMWKPKPLPQQGEEE